MINQEQQESTGVKESLELLEGLIVVVPLPIQALADGKLNEKDFAPALEALKKYETIIEAVKGVDKVVKEAKDYDLQELALIGSKALELVKACQEAYKKGKQA